MGSFGENLRRERELRGVTRAELAAATKIGIRYLSALENNEFDRLPGGVFNRGFVRAVARYLVLDEHEWVSAFVHATNEQPEVLAHYAPSSAAPKATQQRWTSFVLLVILFAAGLFAVHMVRARRAAEEALPALALPVQTTPTLPTTASRPTPAPLVPAAEVSTDQPAPLALPAAPPDGTSKVDLQLQVFAIKDAWVSVAADGHNLYEGLMKPHETRVFRAAGQLDLRTGDASALVLTLNGETLAPLGNPGEVRRITLTRKDLSSLRP
ncbi:MAG: helix-turn-helix domain-containing protein [Terriglobia bacterium]